MKAGLNFFASDQFSPLHKSANVEVGRFDREMELVWKIEVHTTTLRDSLDPDPLPNRN
jgi:hypothetical protein